MAMPLGDLAREHRAHCAVDVADGALENNRLARLDRRPRRFNQVSIEDVFEMVILCLTIADRNAGLWLHLIEDLGKINTFRFPMIDRFAHVEPVDAADHLVKPAET